MSTSSNDASALPIRTSSNRPTVLFACVHNSGRSVAAKILTEHYAKGRVEVLSAGSEPAQCVNPHVTQVLEERGLRTSDEVPTLLTSDLVSHVDVVVTMGCGETCPIVAGKRYLDWSLDDPAGRSLDDVRRIVYEIEQRVRVLLRELGVEITR
ncbi:MAG: arsenate reductase/protein-tyrosine-phosphatase family protein [Acidimicrobiales bacterium]